MMFKAFKELYRRGKIDEGGLRRAVADALITPQQFETITGKALD